MAAHEITEHSAEGFAVLRLRCVATDLDASFVPELSMLGCSLRMGGAEFLHTGSGLAHYAASRRLLGIPLLHPWANRLDGDSYAAAGPTVNLDRDDPLIARDQNGLPIHGLLTGALAWRVAEIHADNAEARLKASFSVAPDSDVYRSFPFPHELQLVVRLQRERLIFETTLTATGDVPVPVAFGFHPYFTLPVDRRATWLVEMPVRRRLVLDERMIPTGRQEAWAFPLAPLGTRRFDDGFADVEDGAKFLLQGRRTRMTVEFREGFPFAQVYAPPDRDFICFEPMTAPCNALVSGERLRRVAPRESFTAIWAIHLEAI